MILDFDISDVSERRISAYNALGNINSQPTIKASHRAFWRLVGGLDVFIII